MTLGFIIIGLLLILVSVLSAGGILLYWQVKTRPESPFSKQVVRLFELYLISRVPVSKDGDAGSLTEAMGLDEVIAKPAPDRPTRVARSGRKLTSLKHGDHVEVVGQLFVVVARYKVHELQQFPPSNRWVPTGRAFDALELHPLDDDPTAVGGGIFVIQLPLDDGQNTRWLLLQRQEYLDADRQTMYAAASAFGKSQGRDRTVFNLQVTGEASWSVVDIATSRFVTEDDGGTFVGSVQVAHVTMDNTAAGSRDPQGLMIWFDYRLPDPEGSGGDLLGVGSEIDPQQVRII